MDEIKNGPDLSYQYSDFNLESRITHILSSCSGLLHCNSSSLRATALKKCGCSAGKLSAYAVHCPLLVGIRLT